MMVSGPIRGLKNNYPQARGGRWVGLGWALTAKPTLTTSRVPCLSGTPRPWPICLYASTRCRDGYGVRSSGPKAISSLHPTLEPGGRLVPSGAVWCRLVPAVHLLGTPATCNPTSTKSASGIHHFLAKTNNNPLTHTRVSTQPSPSW